MVNVPTADGLQAPSAKGLTVATAVINVDRTVTAVRIIFRRLARRILTD